MSEFTRALDAEIVKSLQNIQEKSRVHHERTSLWPWEDPDCDPADFCAPTVTLPPGVIIREIRRRDAAAKAAAERREKKARRQRAREARRTERRHRK